VEGAVVVETYGRMEDFFGPKETWWKDFHDTGGGTEEAPRI